MAGRSALTKKKKLGYAFGIFSDSLYYNMFYTYYLTFLNEIVGIAPKYSSIIIFISIAWDAITDPLIGNYTDTVGVDKRKVMKRAVVPLGLVYVVAWSSIGMGLSSQFFKVLLYTVISMMIWLFYTYYCIPYYAVVAEITDDYDERTEIRSQSSLLNAAAVGLGNILPALVPEVAILLTAKYQSNSYAVIAALMSVGGILTGLICAKSLEGVYEPKKPIAGQAIKKRKNSEVFKSFVSILKMRPARLFLSFVFFFLVGSSMIQSNITYMVIDCIGMKYDTGITIVILVLVASMGITVPFVEKLAKKKDRRTACITFLSITIVGEYLMKILGLDFRIGSFPIMCILSPMFLGIGAGTFWTLFYSMAYDLVELDEFNTGERRESIITAFPQFVQKFGSAFGILMAGQLLSAYGYDSSADVAGKETLIKVCTDAHIISGMENIATLIPAIFLTVCLVMLIIYPMTRERFTALTAALAKKKNGEEFDEQSISKLM